MVEQLNSESTTMRFAQLKLHWQKEKNRRNPSLWTAMWKTFKWQFIIMALYGLLSQIFFALSFFLMASVINNLIDVERSDSLKQGLQYSVAFASSIICFSIFMHLNEFRSASLFIQIRKSMACLLYYKSLALHLHSISQVSQGRIINAATSDLVILDYGQYFISHLFYDPIAIPVYILMLYYLLGTQALIGIAIPFLLFLFSPVCGKCTNKLRDKAATQTDSRLKVLYDLLQGIRIVKAYGLEHKMIAQIKRLRNKESKLICCGTIIKSTNVIGSNQASYFSAALILLVKSLRGQDINAGAAFALLSTFSYFFDNIICGVAGAILYVAEFKASLNRIRDILLLQEKQVNIDRLSITASQNQKTIIKFQEAQVSWTPCTDDNGNVDNEKNQELMGTSSARRINQKSSYSFKLSGLNFTIQEGELVAVVGKVGSGKTTFIHSLLGETYTKGRNFYIKEQLKLSYVQQDPFITSDTLKNNVLFGLNFEEQKFRKVVDLACLTDDLQQLVKGEETLIGERGVNISGGQKTRVSLARALYSQPDVYILDDPFSAVDPKVGARLVQKCVCGALRGKTRIVVTHRLNFVKQASKILFLQRGKLKFSGSYEEFSNREEDIAKISAEWDEGRAQQEAKEKRRKLSKDHNLIQDVVAVENLEIEQQHSGKLSC